MDGKTLLELLRSFMDDEEINSTFGYQLLNMAKDNIEIRRPWMKLRKFQTDISFDSSDGFDDFKDLEDDFLMTYGDEPLKLINGSDVIGFKEIPMEDRDARKDEAQLFYVYHRDGTIAIMGGLSKGYNGTLYYIGRTVDISSGVTWIFPQFSHPLLVVEALVIHRGEVDFDDINARMVNNGFATASAMEKNLDMWDAQLQIRSRRGKPKSDLFNRK